MRHANPRELTIYSALTPYASLSKLRVFSLILDTILKKSIKQTGTHSTENHQKNLKQPNMSQQWKVVEIFNREMR